MTGYVHILPSPRGMGSAHSHGCATYACKRSTIRPLPLVPHQRTEGSLKPSYLTQMYIDMRELPRLIPPGLGTETWPGAASYLCGRFTYSSGRRNSSPNTRTSPNTSCRRTRAVIGGVSFGTRLDDDADGAGIVRCTVCPNRSMCVDVMHAPLALMSKVFVNSINSDPVGSAARRNTGTWIRIRDDCLACG